MHKKLKQFEKKIISIQLNILAISKLSEGDFSLHRSLSIAADGYGNR